MSRIELLPGVADDFGRISDHLAEFDVADIALRIDEIIQAIAVLEYNGGQGGEASGAQKTCALRMSRIELMHGVADDFERIPDHLAESDVADIALRIHEIIQAIAVLEYNPMIGRPVDDDKRELVIGRDARGFVALYRYISEIDTVFILALRGQCEAGYTKT